MKEIWKDIQDYEGLYQISNLGNVRSLKKWCGNRYQEKWKDEIKKLKPTDNGYGYLIISLRKNKKRKNFYIHRLVAKAFLKNEENKSQINHKDYNRYNNKINNLEYCTPKENTMHSSCNMRHSRCVKNKLNAQYIRKKHNKYELTLKRKYIGVFDTLEEAIKIRDDLIKGDDYFDNVNYSKK